MYSLWCVWLLLCGFVIILYASVVCSFCHMFHYVSAWWFLNYADEHLLIVRLVGLSFKDRFLVS